VSARCSPQPLLIRRQGRGVFVFDPQQCAVIARIDQIEHRGFFGGDAVEGEALMSLALMRGARRGQPHPDLFDGGFDQLTGRALGVDR
jgi:hypothetical protein